MHTRILAAVLVFASSLACLTPAAADLVVDGNFSDADWPTPAWTFTPAPVGSDLVLGWKFPVGSADPPTSGTSAWFGAYGGFDDVITQTLATVPGQSYVFSFWLEHGDIFPDNDFMACWGGQTVLSLAGASALPWAEHSFTVVAADSSTPIIFAGRSTSNWYGLDDVSVQSTLVPEPATLSLLVATAAVAALAGRRRKNRGNAC